MRRAGRLMHRSDGHDAGREEEELTFPPSPRLLLARLLDDGHSLDYLEGLVQQQERPPSPHAQGRSPIPRRPPPPTSKPTTPTPSRRFPEAGAGHRPLTAPSPDRSAMYAAWDSCEGLPDAPAASSGAWRAAIPTQMLIAGRGYGEGGVASLEGQPRIEQPDVSGHPVNLLRPSVIASSGAERLLLGGPPAGAEASALGRTLPLPPSRHQRQGRGTVYPPSGGAWVNRRNAWLRRFLDNCSEQVDVPQLIGFERGTRGHWDAAALLQPLMQHEGDEEEGGQGRAEEEEAEEESRGRGHAVPAEEPRPPSPDRVLRRTLSTPERRSETHFLSAEDMATALAPRRRGAAVAAAAARQGHAAIRGEDELLRETARSSSGIRLDHDGGRDGTIHGGLFGIQAMDVEAGPPFGGDHGRAPLVRGDRREVGLPASAKAAAGVQVSVGPAAAAAAATGVEPQPPRKSLGGGFAATLAAHLSAGWARIPKQLLVLLLVCWMAYLALQVGIQTMCGWEQWVVTKAQLMALHRSLPLHSVSLMMGAFTWTAYAGGAQPVCEVLPHLLGHLCGANPVDACVRHRLRPVALEGGEAPPRRRAAGGGRDGVAGRAEVSAAVAHTVPETAAAGSAGPSCG